MELGFLGFIIMQNTLKPETTPVISALLNANIRTVMITGTLSITVLNSASAVSVGFARQF